MNQGFISSAQSVTTLRDVIDARYAIAQIMRRDFIVRYRQTLLGWLWAIFNPAVSLIIYATVFGLILQVRTTEYPVSYWAVLMIGILYWNLFTASLNVVGDSLINNLQLVKKVWFPRIIFGLAGMLTAAIDFLVAFMLFILLLVLSHQHLYLRGLLGLAVIAIAMALTGFGIGCLLAILKIKFRDFRHIVPLFLQLLFYGSAVVYTPAFIPAKFRWVFSVNPISSALDLARRAIFKAQIEVSAIAGLLLISLIIAAAGWVIFARYERAVMDGE